MYPRSKLSPEQLQGIEFIKNHDRCALTWDCGVAKTIPTITAFADMLASFDSRHMLVVGPKRVVRKGWPDQIAEWEHTKHLSTSVIVGNADECLRALRTKADVHLINRDRVSWLYAQFVQHGKQVMRWPFDLVVLDEAHSFRNASGIRFKQMDAFCQAKLFPRMVQLSGTYTPNGLRNAWAPMYLLDRGQRLGPTESGYLNRYFTPPRHEFGKWRIKTGAAEEIAGKMADICYTLRESDVMSLPPVIINPVMVELPPKALALYRKFKREFIAEIGGTKIAAASDGALRSKLMQLANGAVYDEGRAVVPVHDAKIKALVDLLDSLDGRQVLIVYAFKHDQSRIEATLRKEFPGAVTKSLKTDTDEDDWNAGKIDHLLIHPDSAGEGTNLHKNVDAEDIIWFGATPDLLQWLQTNARLFGGRRRVGKRGTVHVLLADDTIDEVYRDLIVAKDVEQEDFKLALQKYARFK